MKNKKHLPHSFKRMVCLITAGMMVLSAALTGCGSESITSQALEDTDGIAETVGDNVTDNNNDAVGDVTDDNNDTGADTGDKTEPASGSVSVRLDASTNEVEPGGEIDYVVTVESAAPEGSENVQLAPAKIELALDETFEVLSAETAPERKGNISGQGTSKAEFNMTEFTAGETVVFKVKAQAPDDLEEDMDKTATATLSYRYNDEDRNTSASVTVKAKAANPVVGATKAAVTMVQTAGGTETKPGNKVSYKVSAALSSDIESVVNAKEVQLHVDIPSAFTGVDVTGYKNGSPFAGSFTEGIATADFGDVKLSDTLEMEVSITIPDNYDYQEVEFKGYASGRDITSEEKIMKLSTTEVLERVVDEPSVYMTWKDLNSTKERTYRTSDVLPVSILITNKDKNVDMKNVVVKVEVPKGFNVIEDLDAEGIVSDKTEFVWHIETIEKDSKYNIDLGFVPTAGKDSDVFEGSAVISYGNHPLDKDAEISTNVLKGKREIPKADVLSIKVFQNNTDEELVVPAGQNVAYGTTITNNGEVDLKNIVVKGQFGAGLIYGRSDKKTVTQKDGLVTWKVDELKAGESQTMLFGVTLPDKSPAASYTFQMEGTGDDIAKTESNKLTMKTGSSDVVAEMWQRKSGMEEGIKDDLTVNYGETYTYVIVVGNEGKAAAKNVVVTTAIPGSLTLNQSTMVKGMTYDNSTLKWNISELGAGESKKAAINVTAPTGVNTNTTSSQSASVKGMTVNTKSTVSWADGADKPGTSESNVVVTKIENKVESPNPDPSTSPSGDKTKPVNNSGLDTVVISKTTGTQMLAYQDSDTIKVTAKYTNLKANTHYTGTVGLVNESGGVIKQTNGADATAKLDFMTSGTSGNIGSFEFTVDGKAYTGKCMYGAINVKPDEGGKKSYNGVGFDQSTIRSASVMGAAVSYPTVSASKNAQASVAVGYDNVVSGASYQVVVTIIDRSTKKAIVMSNGKEAGGTANFKASESKGQIDVPVSFGSDDVKGKDLAVYTTLYDANGKTVLAIDQDANRTKTSGSSLVSNNNITTTNASEKGDQREIVKTGENDGMPIAMAFVGLCIMAGAGFLIFKKRNIIKSLLGR